MKSLITLALLLTSLNTFAAARLRCSGAKMIDRQGKVVDSYLPRGGIGDRYEFECHDKKGYEYIVRMEGTGLSPEVIGDIGYTFSISCPLVKQKNIYGTYHGVRLSGAVGFGLKAGFSFGKNAKACVVAAIGTGVGGSIVYDKMTITDKWADKDYEEIVVVE